MCTSLERTLKLIMDISQTLGKRIRSGMCSCRLMPTQPHATSCRLIRVRDDAAAAGDMHKQGATEDEVHNDKSDHYGPHLRFPVSLESTVSLDLGVSGGVSSVLVLIYF